MKGVGPRAAVGAWNPGAVWAWGLQQVWLLTSMTAPSVYLSLAVVVPEISPVNLQVATVEVRSHLPASVSPWSLVHLSPPWAGKGHSHPCSCHALSLQATDADSGQGGNITFSIISVVLVEDNGVSRPFENLFWVFTTLDKDTYVGSIR